MESESVVVSMTTTPMRISKIEPVLNSILTQTVQPSKIYMHIPHIFKRENLHYEIPDFILNNDKIFVNRCDDMGPITKILPIVDVLQDPNALVVSVDDDIVYHPTMIETLLENNRKHGGECVVCGTTGFGNVNESDMSVEHVEGYSGVLYKRKFLDDFDRSVLEHTECLYGDDYIISQHLKKKGVPMFSTEKEQEYRSRLIFTELSENSDAMYKGANGKLDNNGDRYAKCSKKIYG
jgi:hypothetical protein